VNLLEDIITYVRRIVKVPSNESLSSDLIIDYINRFWLMDVCARMELFDLKTTYQFSTFAGRNKYNMPLYSVNGYVNGPQPTNQTIGQFPVYQGFTTQARIDNRELRFYTDRSNFLSSFYTPFIRSVDTIASGATTYAIKMDTFPLIPAHVDITGIIATGSILDPIISTTLDTNVPKTSVYSSLIISAVSANCGAVRVVDSGQFLGENQKYGLLMNGFDASSLGTYSTTSNTVNYTNGEINVTFPEALLEGSTINVSGEFFSQGQPVGILFYNNVLELLPPPDKSYVIELDGFLSPAAFLVSSNAIPFGYMAEYIARGAARKILSDTGDFEQFQFYEPLFKEQEILVWKRSQRQITATPAYTIFTSGYGINNNYYGGAL